MPYTKRIAHHKTADDLISYICNDEKTDGGLLVNSINCSSETAAQEFKNNNFKYKNKGSRVAYHLIQSFHPDDPITPEQANEIGVKLCEELYGDFQCVIATHIDKGHIHNHIAINATNINGRKLEDRLANQKEGIYGYKTISDQLAREYGCFVLPAQEIKISKNKDYYYEYKRATWKENIISDIDRVKENSKNLDELCQELIALGYDVKYGKHIAVKAVGMKKYARLDNLGEGYSENELEEYFGTKVEPMTIQDLQDITTNTFTVSNFSELRIQKAKESRDAILITSKIANNKQYSQYQRTRYQELKRFRALRDELNMLNEHNVYSYDDLTSEVEKLRLNIKTANQQLYNLKNESENKTLLDRAEKAQDFIRLYKINDYAEYYKSIDADYKLPNEVNVFNKIKQELGITTIEEAHDVIKSARELRLEINKKKSEIVEMQREMNKLDIVKEETLIKSDLYIHNIKFGANRIDYENSTTQKWCVNLPYTDLYMMVDKSQVTFNSKNEFYTLFLVDDMEYNIYSSDEVKKNWDKAPKDKKELLSDYSLKGTNIESLVNNKKMEYLSLYKDKSNN